MKALPRLSFGVGDRFAHEAEAQLAAFEKLAAAGVVVAPVWNKSNREHSFIGSTPASVTSVDLTPLSLSTRPPDVAFPLDTYLIPSRTDPHSRHGPRSRRELVDGKLWALECSAPQLSKSASGEVERTPCSLTPAQRERRWVVTFRERNWLSTGAPVDPALWKGVSDLPLGPLQRSGRREALRLWEEADTFGTGMTA